MALRLIDLYVVDGDHQQVLKQLDQYEIQDFWHVGLEDNRHLVQVLVDTSKSEFILDGIYEHCKGGENFRVVVSSVEATLPFGERPEAEEPPPAEVTQSHEQSVERISRVELWEDLEESIRGTKIYLALVGLSAVVAAGGMMRDSVAIVVGAMVIAPLIGPNIAFAFATTVGDADFLRRSFQINLTGLLLALGLSVLVGFFFEVDPTVSEIANRTAVHWSDIILALAAGAAGVLSFTRGISTALIGVMVAVALLPPLVAVGLLMGSAWWNAAYMASMLVLTNIVCINLAGVVTFLLQGIRPMDWYEAERARRHTWIAIMLWGLLLVVVFVLAVVVGLEPRF